MPNVRALFILKAGFNYNYSGYGNHKSSGLRNSASFVSDMLNAAGIESKVVIVTDNNDIDREVSQFHPTHVFIEALWVVPEKFKILHALHPHVKWIIRIHSELPFLALEGIAVSWLKQYVHLRDVFVASNSIRGVEELETVVGQKVLYLPNFYPGEFHKHKKFNAGVINVGCFGAIRPLKNILSQGVAALQFARINGLDLRFHINGNRVEDGGPVLKNLRALFAHDAHAELVEHDWANHNHFIHTIHKMDLHLSASLTETFSIVTADAVSQGVPIVTSPEVFWVNPKSQARATDVDDIIAKMADAFDNKQLVRSNQKRLKRYSADSKREWLKYLEGKKCSVFSSFFS